MADFYSILRRTIEALPVATGQTRQAVYERARAALNNQLDTMNPPLPPSEVSRQRLSLEDNIRVVEEEFLAGRIVLNVERENARRAAELDNTQANLKVERTAKMLQEETEQFQPRMPVGDDPFSVAPSPQSGLTPDNQTREVAATFEPRRGEPEHAGSHAELASHSDRDAERENRAISSPQRQETYTHSLEDESGYMSSSNRGASLRRRRRGDYEATPALDDSFYADEDREYEDDFYDNGYEEETSHSARSRPARQRLGRAQQHKEALALGDFVEDNDYYHAEDDYGYARPRRRVWPWILLFILVLGLSGAGYYAYMNWPSILPLVEKWLGMEDRPVEPINPPISGEQGDTQDAPRRIQLDGDSNPDEQDDKDSNRILDDQGNMNPKANEGADTSFAIGRDTLRQSAILYEENQAQDQSRAFRGGVSWRLQQGVGELPVIVGRIEVPARNLSLDMILRKNSDASLSASHLIELSFAAPRQTIGTGIQDVPAVMLKEGEEAQGEVLTSVSVKVSETLFWIALSAGSDDVERNVNLLGNNSWFDIPVLFGNGRRAIISLEKGQEGEQVFAQALQAWTESP